MRKVVSISLGSSERDYEFSAEFFGRAFHVRRIGCDGDVDLARRMVREHDGQVDAIGLAGMAVEFRVGRRVYRHRPTLRVARAARYTPVVGGRGLRRVVDRWAVADLAEREKELFHRRNVLFMSGIANWDLVEGLREHTDSLTFGDPILHFGAPTPLRGVQALEGYARVAMPLLTRRPYVSFFPRGPAGENLQIRMLRPWVQRADIVVGDLSLIRHYCPSDMRNKVVLTDSIDDEALADLRQRGVRVVCSTMPSIGGARSIGLGVLQAIMVANLDKRPATITADDYMDLVRELNLRPRLIHVQGEEKRVAKFVYVWVPNDRDSLAAQLGGKALSLLPDGGKRVLERGAAHFPPGFWTRLHGISSPQGVDAQAWIYYLPWTPATLESMDPRRVAEKIEDIAAEAESLGASLVGLSARSSALARAGARAARNSTVPITSGFSATASATFWAAREACLRMGFETAEDGRFDRRALLAGVSGGWSDAAAQLLAVAFQQITLVDRDPGHLLSLARRIEASFPGTRVAVAHELGTELPSADLLVTGLSRRSRDQIDLGALRPGSVVLDCQRPMEFTAEDQAQRPDVLIIRAGMLEVPGAAHYERSLELPDKVAPASLCEAAVLALAARAECFTNGPEPTLSSVKDIYRLLVEHGFSLSGIHGVDAMLRDPEIALARERGELRLLRETEAGLPALEAAVSPPTVSVRMDEP
jgi:predicted amino acid dehydrogenase